MQRGMGEEEERKGWAERRGREGMSSGQRAGKEGRGWGPHPGREPSLQGFLFFFLQNVYN